MAESPKKPPAGSAPSLEVGYAPAGRETLAEIVGELSPEAGEPAEAEPTLTLGETFVERETMAAIQAELVSDVAAARRPSQDAAPPRPAPPDAPRPATQPGRPRPATRLDAPRPATPPTDATPHPSTPQGLPARQASSRSPDPAPAAARPELFELLTFVVRGADVSRLASERARRDFVGDWLLARLPVASVDEIERIDASPWTEQSSIVLRVLCRIST